MTYDEAIKRQPDALTLAERMVRTYNRELIALESKPRDQLTFRERKEITRLKAMRAALSK